MLCFLHCIAVTASGSNRIPLVGLLRVFRYPQTPLVQDSEIVLTVRQAVLGGRAEPFGGAGQVRLAVCCIGRHHGQIVHSLDVSLAGSGDIVLDIETTAVEGSIAGSGDLTLKGNTDDLNAKVAGSGDFHGFTLQANNTTVSVAGSGDAEVVCNKSLKARVAGSGDIEYRGNPDMEDTKVSGSGTISN